MFLPVGDQAVFEFHDDGPHATERLAIDDEGVDLVDEDAIEKSGFNATRRQSRSWMPGSFVRHRPGPGFSSKYRAKQA